jgi:predicted restriction endonuclease
MKQKTRKAVYEKFNGRCAYCGRVIEFKDMQVDHIIPQHINPKLNPNTDREENLNPSCRRCNHYKRGNSLETYRGCLTEMRRKLLDTYLGKVALDYGMVAWIGWDGKFYFEYAADLEKEADQ